MKSIADPHYNWTQEIAQLLLVLVFLGGLALACYILCRGLPNLKIKTEGAPKWVLIYTALLITTGLLTVIVGMQSIVQIARIIFLIVYES